MPLTSRTAVAPTGAICFGCNQGFDGNPVALQFETDLLPPAATAELHGLYFHPHHLLRYARRRDWTALAQHIESQGSARF
jgi:hypothetical protein